MTSFMTSLWESVFTPGPTPTLIVATNASFAALQLILLSLLIATYSIHFVILSILSAGLWWSINWFVAELHASQAQAEKTEKEGASLEDEREDIARNDGRVMGGGAGKDSDTETEEATPAPEERPPTSSATTTTTTGRLRAEDVQTAKKRRSGAAGASESEGSVSTDSEWEKVDDQ